MRFSYGWVVVDAGIVVTGIGFGTALSLGVFLQPMSIAVTFHAPTGRTAPAVA